MNAIDLDMIAELKSLLGDDFNLFLKTFKNDMATRKAAIYEAMSQSDAEAVRLAAHSLKGSSSNLGAEALTAVCATLELQAHKGDLSNADTLYSEIEKNSQKVLEELQKLV